MANWRQGDVILGDEIPPFIFLADMRCPLSAQARERAAAGGLGLDVVDAPAPGLAIITGTCELVRTCADRPLVEVCPLVELPPGIFDQVRRGRRPQYAALSGVANRGLAVDFDRVMTLEKSVLAPLDQWREAGVRSETEARAFARAAARKRDRPALPDTFVQSMQPVRRRILEKHGKSSPEGRFLSSVDELRVKPNPSWGADITYAELLFVYERLSDVPDNADVHIAELCNRFAATEAYPELRGRAVSLETMSAAAYLDSDLLDLEHLSMD